MLNLKVINLFGAPGVGKSTTAAGLFNLMKLHGYSVEYVPEYAKDLTWSKDWMGLSHQLSVLAEQDYRLRRLAGQVEWVITDSPLPMQIAYYGPEWVEMGLDKTTWSAFERYYNFNILLARGDFPYEQAGRNQTTEQAMMLDNVIDNLFHTAILGDEDFSLELTPSASTPYEISAWLLESEAGGTH